MIQALNHDAVREIKAEAYAVAGDDHSAYMRVCIEIAMEYPHYASAKEIAYSFEISYSLVRQHIAEVKQKARKQRNERYKDEHAAVTFRTVR